MGDRGEEQWRVQHEVCTNDAYHSPPTIGISVKMTRILSFQQLLLSESYFVRPTLFDSGVFSLQSPSPNSSRTPLLPVVGHCSLGGAFTFRENAFSGNCPLISNNYVGVASAQF